MDGHQTVRVGRALHFFLWGLYPYNELYLADTQLKIVLRFDCTVNRRWSIVRTHALTGVDVFKPAFFLDHFLFIVYFYFLEI